MKKTPPAPRTPAGTLRLLVRKGEAIIDAALAADDLTLASVTLERLARTCGHWTDGKGGGSSTGAAAASRSPPDREVVVFGAEPITAEQWSKLYPTPG
ncbi:MAG: hypothetical protein U1E50_11830 [Caulobacteraceae bacterium]